MDIKQERKKINISFNTDSIISFIFGGGTEGKSKDLRLFSMGSTMGIWFAAFLGGSIIFLMNGTTMVYVETLVYSFMIAGLVGFGATIVSTFGNGDFNSEYGWGMWWRSLIYNILFFASFYLINTGATVVEHRELVTEFELVKSDIKDCKYMVKMKSDTLVYDHCSDYDHTYNDIRDSKDLNVYLIGKVRYGTNEADHMETVTKKIKRGKK